jgi:hypothetical protein
VSGHGSHARTAAAGVNLAIEAATAEVVRALSDARVQSIVLKGPSLTRWLYTDAAARSSTDVDLLVSPHDFERAEAVLSSLHYELLSLEGIPYDRPWNAHAWHGPRGIDVDLHRALVGVGAPAEEAWQVLRAEVEAMEVGGRRVDVFGPMARALHVALHAAQHGVRYEKAFVDLERALEAVPTATWERAAELAVRLDAVPAFVAGLSLLPTGAAIVDGLALPKAESVEAVLLATSPPPTAGGFEWLARVPGVRAKAVFLLHKLFPPAAWLRTWSPLARRGFLGLAAAYAWRPLWLLLHAGPGLLAWRRARRRARSVA